MRINKNLNFGSRPIPTQSRRCKLNQKKVGLSPGGIINNQVPGAYAPGAWLKQ
jgi:hypothetical protein